MIPALRSLLRRLRGGLPATRSFERALEEALDRDPVSLRVASLERLLCEGDPQGADPLAACLGSTEPAAPGGSNGGTNDASL